MMSNESKCRKKKIVQVFFFDINHTIWLYFLAVIFNNNIWVCYKTKKYINKKIIKTLENLKIVGDAGISKIIYHKLLLNIFDLVNKFMVNNKKKTFYFS